MLISPAGWALDDSPILDLARIVTTDVNRVLWAVEIPQNVRASGYVYDVGTGLVTTIVDATSRKEQTVRRDHTRRSASCPRLGCRPG